ncbi:MAG TPA: hypothetical protein G4O15_06080 [Dehalococcoidia bacterium]|nr:hypothetical protein [Dehalococcoidia bacterium]
MDRINELAQKLLSLMGDLDFSGDERALDSPEIALEVGARYNREYERFEAMEQERKERILNLMSEIFAIMVQILAIRQYGNDGSTAIRQVLTDIAGQAEVKDRFNRRRNTAKRALETTDLSAEQINLIMAGVIDEIPSLLIDRFTQLYTPYQLLPLNNTQSIASVLTDMLKETERADDRTDN